MDRRDSLKALLVTTVSGGVLLEACKNPQTEKEAAAKPAANDADRMEEEKLHDKKLKDETFFKSEEMATIGILADIIIPKDNVSGSATDAKVPDFIEFIVKDMPEYQTPMRGGLRWLDLQCLNRYGNPFKDCPHNQQIEMVDRIAYPNKAKPDMAQGVAFFNLMRNLTATGFYTTEIGWKDVGYVGNTPNQWNGVPDDVLKQYDMAYTEKELKECVSFSKA
ncbi:gluconate 2-dehydrogenase subunit 3 family protein [Mucilaginibacter sp. RS28]|uniref:Gluconate 2-dehydrogenase subunit 3 family protein n=1 Tax=Mucilaginibacter straminoryzae TaxID=2932774 RepID=A0A9X1X3H6_9SPHI|nr:gluconate 2-dehydrogenase subunit 3 family protein [Mucilaginibacter straminoryzae]MCJ8210532.1 gluconate 2-dehydrogenase subunit 3 family protein [Mucilaginibacter straminoryzae]